MNRDIGVRRLSRIGKEFGFGYLLLAPVVLYIVLFQFYPLFETVRLSLFNYSLITGNAMTFVGLDNYVHLIAEDKNFWPIFKNSLVWVLGSTALQFAVAIPAALLLNAKIPSRGLWRGLIMVPWVSPVVIIGIIWKWIFDGQYGLANHYLKALHLLSENIVWLGDEKWVWPALLLASTWKGFPYVTLMLLSGLQGISREMMEAALVDGARGWQRFRYVTLPLLRPIMYTTGLVSIVSSWTKFEMIWVLTNGGPGFATSILPTYLYTHAFQYFDLGMGAAIGTLSMLLVIVIVLVYQRLFNKETF
jgi:multiple sugar transport system permease protein